MRFHETFPHHCHSLYRFLAYVPQFYVFSKLGPWLNYFFWYFHQINKQHFHYHSETFHLYCWTDLDEPKCSTSFQSCQWHSSRHFYIQTSSFFDFVKELTQCFDHNILHQTYRFSSNTVSHISWSLIVGWWSTKSFPHCLRIDFHDFFWYLTRH